MKIKLSERERWLVFFAVVMAVVYLFYGFLAAPLLNRIGESQKTYRTLRNELIETRGKAKILDSLGGRSLRDVAEQKSREERITEALQYLSSSVTTLKLNLRSIRPSAEERKVGFANATDISLAMTGSYNSLYRFILNLEELPIPIEASSISITGTDGGIAVDMVVTVYY